MIDSRVVKVQAPVLGVDSEVLVYDEKREVCFSCAMTPGIQRMMDGRAKAFFIAVLDDETQEFTLIEEVEPRAW